MLQDARRRADDLPSPDRSVVKLPGLDALRFFAAMMIAFHHLARLPPLSPPRYLSWTDTHFAFGVPLFFVLSAFAMCVGMYGKLESSDDIRKFYMRRFFRIAPLFYTVIIMYIPLRYLTGGAASSISQTLTSAAFIFNFIPSHVGGAVPAAWSIGTEMAFYLIFPLVAISVTSPLRFAMLSILTCVLGLYWEWEVRDADPSLKAFASYSIFSQMCYFTAGIGAYFGWKKIRNKRGCWVAGAVLIAISTLSITGLVQFDKQYLYFLGRNIGWDYCNYFVKVTWAFFLALTVIGVAVYPIRIIVNRFTVTMGKASFSLYLFHPFLIIILIKARYTEWIKVEFSAEWEFVVAAMVLVALLFPLALLSYRLIEIPGMRLIRYLDPSARLPTAAGKVGGDI